MVRKESVDSFKPLVVSGDSDVQQLVVAAEFNTDGNLQGIGWVTVFGEIVPLTRSVFGTKPTHFDIRGGVVYFGQDEFMYPFSTRFVEKALHG